MALNARASGQGCWVFGWLVCSFFFFKRSVICFKNADLNNFLLLILPHISSETNIDQYFLRVWLLKQRECSGSRKILV